MAIIIQAKVRGFTQVEFLSHALDQMKMRDISADAVIRAIKNPTETGLPTQMFRLRIRRQTSRGKALDVVYEELPDRIRVITAFEKKFD